MLSSEPNDLKIQWLKQDETLFLLQGKDWSGSMMVWGPSSFCLVNIFHGLLMFHGPAWLLQTLL